jgi:hypothetical protein
MNRSPSFVGLFAAERLSVFLESTRKSGKDDWRGERYSPPDKTPGLEILNADSCKQAGPPIASLSVHGSQPRGELTYLRSVE